MSGFAGFDSYGYPGDAAMFWLQANTIAVWCGYYLAPTPSHSGTSWMGTRASLAAAGWGIAPVYLGQQTVGPGSHNPSAANGTTDGAQAAAMMATEGFPVGSYVYLDIEDGSAPTPLVSAYISSWCAAVAAANYCPGIYCSHNIALQVQALCPAARIWAFKVPTTAQHPVTPSSFQDPDPSGSGYASAYIWQLDQNGTLAIPAVSGGSLGIDLSSALTADPGAPDPPPAVAGP